MLEMDPSQRAVLQSHHMEIAQDLVITEDFLGKCYQEKLFDSYLIDIIRSEKTIFTKAYKVLELLPKRGPDAFDIFVRILRTTCPWMAKKLEDSLAEEREQSQKSGLDSPFPNGMIFQSELKQDVAQVQSVVQKQLEINESHIKEKLEHFIQKTFGLHRKLSQADKRAVERFLHDQIHFQQQKHLRELEAVAENSEISKALPNSMQTWLSEMYFKLKSQTDVCDCDDIGRMESDHLPAKSVTPHVLESLIEMLLRRNQQIEKQLSYVYDLFPEKFRKKSLTKLVQDVMMQSQEMEKELRRLHKENDVLYQENFTITMDKKKLEHDTQLRDVQLEVKTNQIQKLQFENKNLLAEVEKLQRINIRHAEKEKTLGELQMMVNELRESQEYLANENTNLKSKLDSDRKENGRSNQSPRRQMSYSKGQNTKGCKFKGGNKKKTNPYQKG